jgi:hypothetical protein
MEMIGGEKLTSRVMQQGSTKDIIYKGQTKLGSETKVTQQGNLPQGQVDSGEILRIDRGLQGADQGTRDCDRHS